MLTSLKLHALGIGVGIYAGLLLLLTLWRTLLGWLDPTLEYPALLTWGFGAITLAILVAGGFTAGRLARSQGFLHGAIVGLAGGVLLVLLAELHFSSMGMTSAARWVVALGIVGNGFAGLVGANHRQP